MICDNCGNEIIGKYHVENHSNDLWSNICDTCWKLKNITEDSFATNSQVDALAITVQRELAGLTNRLIDLEAENKSLSARIYKLEQFAPSERGY